MVAWHDMACDRDLHTTCSKPYARRDRHDSHSSPPSYGLSTETNIHSPLHKKHYPDSSYPEPHLEQGPSKLLPAAVIAITTIPHLIGCTSWAAQNPRINRSRMILLNPRSNAQVGDWMLEAEQKELTASGGEAGVPMCMCI